MERALEIFKVQRPVACTPGAEMELYVYNRDRTLRFQGPVSQETRRELFPHDEYKVFRWGRLRDDGETIELKGEAAWQEW
jgi:hypothetical protein